jgi:serine/threonine protein kinase
LDKRTDIWSFGSVLFEMITKEVPFEDETLTGLASLAQNHLLLANHHQRKRSRQRRTCLHAPWRWRRGIRVSPDGQRFLIGMPVGEAEASRINLIVNLHPERR